MLIKKHFFCSLFPQAPPTSYSYRGGPSPLSRPADQATSTDRNFQDPILNSDSFYSRSEPDFNNSPPARQRRSQYDHLRRSPIPDLFDTLPCDRVDRDEWGQRLNRSPERRDVREDHDLFLREESRRPQLEGGDELPPWLRHDINEGHAPHSHHQSHTIHDRWESHVTHDRHVSYPLRHSYSDSHPPDYRGQPHVPRGDIKPRYSPDYRGPPQSPPHYIASRFPPDYRGPPQIHHDIRTRYSPDYRGPPQNPPHDIDSRFRRGSPQLPPEDLDCRPSLRRDQHQDFRRNDPPRQNSPHLSRESCSIPNPPPPSNHLFNDRGTVPLPPVPKIKPKTILAEDIFDLPGRKDRPSHVSLFTVIEALAAQNVVKN